MKGSPMSTARGVALVRALEMRRPERERITSDPYAAHFADRWLMWATRLSIATGLSNLMGVEGMINFALLRERYVDDLMRSELAGGAAQIVVLGAGFDTRAYRLGRPDVPVFEVDHPDTQADKRRALAGVVDPFPANVHFVPVDFDIDDLGGKLAAAGYDRTRRTLFVWQGVVPYLTQEGIERTLAVIADNAGLRTLLVFDYGVAERPGSTGMPAMLDLFTRAMGERTQFGLPRAELEGFLAARGFAEVSSIDCIALRARYVAAGRRLPVSRSVAIATARVRRP